jgi:hypothetical protein
MSRDADVTVDHVTPRWPHVASRRVPLQKTDPPASHQDSGALRTVLDARTYMLALSEDRKHRAQRQRAAELLLAEADVAAFSNAVELALFYDAKLELGT